MGPTGGLSNAGLDAIGFIGGGMLAICLIPQIGKIIITRSARDISYAWSILYCIGTSLSLVYLVLKNALAAWLPLLLEIAGCIIILGLKTFYEHTAQGRRWCAALGDPQAVIDASVHSLPGINHMASLPADVSWRGTNRSNHGSKHGASGVYASHLDVQCGSIAVPITTIDATGRQDLQNESLYPHNWKGVQAVFPLQQQ